MPDFDITKKTLKFPLTWHGSLVVEGERESEFAFALENVMRGCAISRFEISEGRQSSGGKYHTWKLTADFSDVMQFRATTQALGTLPGVKMLI